jgi:hypothetical protein
MLCSGFRNQSPRVGRGESGCIRNVPTLYSFRNELQRRIPCSLRRRQAHPVLQTSSALEEWNDEAAGVKRAPAEARRRLIIGDGRRPTAQKLSRATTASETPAEHPHKAPRGGRSAELTSHRNRAIRPAVWQLAVSPLRCPRAATPKGARDPSTHANPNPPLTGLTTHQVHRVGQQTEGTRTRATSEPHHEQHRPSSGEPPRHYRRAVSANNSG